MLTTFPPTECGIATFSAALTSGLVAAGATVDVVRLGARPPVEDPSVAAAWEGDRAGTAAAVAALNRTDVVVVQHEYGIYPGPDGDGVLDVLAGVRVPVIVVAHTVLARPTAGQRRVLEAVCAAADAVVVMTDRGRKRLVEDYDVDPRRITTIPHGAAVLLTPRAPRPPGGDRPPRLLTWGLLGPGKGIEWAVDAMAQLTDLRPAPTYLVAGATHPKVVARHGEAYREALVARATRAGLAEVVAFDDTYRDLAALTRLIATADLVVLPYDSPDQVTSGVLVDAVAAGRPVVSTAFPHAVELLATGAGIVVPQRDPAALAAAVRRVLTDPDLAATMAAEARRLAPALSWEAVSLQYAELGGRLLDLRRMGGARRDGRAVGGRVSA